MNRLKLSIASALLLAACSSPAPYAPLPFNLTGPAYRLNVSQVSMTQDYVAPRHMPNVDHLSDIPPAEAVKQWAASKIIAVGKANQLEINIKEASIVEHDLPKQKSGIEGFFTKEQTEQYDGTLEVEMKIYNGRALPAAHLDVTAHQSHTLSEDATLVDRQEMYHRISVELMQQLEIKLDENIHSYFAKYLM